MITAKDIISNEYLSVDVQNTAAELIGRMKKKDVTFALVFEGKKYLGLVDKRWLLTSRLDSHQMKIQNILKKRSKSKTPFFVPKLALDTSLKEICRLMAASNTRALPAMEKDKIDGVVTASAVLNELKGEYKGIKAKQLATMMPITAQEKEELGKVIQKMHDNHIDRVPVVDKMNKLMGIATLNDIAKYYFRYPAKAQRVSARGSRHATRQDGNSGEKQKMLKSPIMNFTKPVQVCFTAGPDTPMHDVIQMMADDDVCSIIIEEKEIPLGIITAKDILQDYAR